MMFPFLSSHYCISEFYCLEHLTIYCLLGKFQFCPKFSLDINSNLAKHNEKFPYLCYLPTLYIFILLHLSYKMVLSAQSLGHSRCLVSVICLYNRPLYQVPILEHMNAQSTWASSLSLSLIILTNHLSFPTPLLVSATSTHFPSSRSPCQSSPKQI